MFKNIIFDFDGTLANTISATLNALKQAFQELDIFYDDTKLNERLFVMPSAQYSKLVSESIPANKLDAVLSRYRALKNENFKTDTNIRTYPGIENLLKKLKANRHNLFVATNGSKDTFFTLIKFLFNENPFEDFRAAEGTKSEMVEHLIEIHNLDRSKTVIVGDGLGDINAGKSAGIKTIAVDWGYEEDKTLLKDSANFYAETTEELESFLTGAQV
jgi:phosphoglycolate phosphatase-like HAD superfamily hydrolase